MRIAKLHSLLHGELFGAAADQETVFAVLQNPPGQDYRIPNALHGADRAGFEGRAIHQDRVELGLAVSMEIRAVSGIKSRIVFQQHNDSLACIQRGAAGFQYRPTGGEGPRHAIPRSLFHSRAQGPGAAVHDESDGLHG